VPTVVESTNEPDAAPVPDGEPPQPPPTGDQAVDAVVAALAAVVAEPLEDRLGVLEKVHRALEDRLADVEE
jgi:hypothetical protein